MSRPVIRDMKPAQVKLFDLNDRHVGTMQLAPGIDSRIPRRIVWQGRTFTEGDGTGFYGANEFAEIRKGEAA